MPSGPVMSTLVPSATQNRQPSRLRTRSTLSHCRGTNWTTDRRRVELQGFYNLAMASRKVIDAIKDGFAGPELKAEMDELQARKESLLARLATADAPVPLLHPNLAALYREKVATLPSTLQNAESRSEAAEALRGLVDAIVLVPAGNELRIELKGNLAAMLSAAQNAKRSPEGDLSLQIALVAGARLGLYRKLCWVAA